MPAPADQFQVHDELSLALGRLRADTGREFSIVQKDKVLLKWGYLSSTANATWETIQEGGGTETMLTTNAITVIDSTSASDTMSVTVEGHYLTADDDLVFVVQTKTLTGLTAAALDTPLARCSRMYITGTEAAVGTITVNAGEGGTSYNQITAGDSQSEKAATSLSYKDALIVTEFGASILGSNNAQVRFRAEYEPKGGVWRPQARWSLNANQVDYERTGFVPWIMPPNADVRMRCIATAAGTSVEAHFSGYLATDVALLGVADPAAA